MIQLASNSVVNVPMITKDKTKYFRNKIYFLLTWNQSMVQHLTIAGNLRIWFRKLSPMGLIASIMCSWSFTIDTNKLKRAIELPSVYKHNRTKASMSDLHANNKRSS